MAETWRRDIMTDDITSYINCSHEAICKMCKNNSYVVELLSREQSWEKGKWECLGADRWPLYILQLIEVLFKPVTYWKFRPLVL